MAFDPVYRLGIVSHKGYVIANRFPFSLFCIIGICTMLWIDFNQTSYRYFWLWTLGLIRLALAQECLRQIVPELAVCQSDIVSTKNVKFCIEVNQTKFTYVFRLWSASLGWNCNYLIWSGCCNSNCVFSIYHRQVMKLCIKFNWNPCIYFDYGPIWNLVESPGKDLS